jgi:1,4-dihydroxy-2-naphthoyl-CoA hydrolase
LHGGTSVALTEAVGSLAGAMVVDPARFVVAGKEINANHIRPAFDDFVVATAKEESLGRTTQIWTIRIENEEGKLVCLSRFAAAVIPAERK